MGVAISNEKKEKLKLALSLLCEENTSLDKLNKICTFLKGVNPSIDKHLVAISQIAEKIKKVQDGDVVALSLEKIPETSKKQKDRKKLILLLLGHWNSLKSEIARIQALNASAAAAQSGTDTSLKMGKIIATAKGPLGVITIAAAGIVAISTLINNSAVDISVKNLGCSPLGPVSKKAINIPGIQLPSKAIYSGDNANIKLPGLDITMEVYPGKVFLKALKVGGSYEIPNEIKDIVIDGKSLMGKETLVKLSSSKTHEIIIKCIN